MSEQLLRLDRLDEVAVGPGFQAVNLIMLADESGGNVQDGNLGRRRQCPDAATDLEAVEVRQADVEDDEVGRVALDDFDGFRARSGFQYREAFLAKDPSEGGADGVLVIDAQDRGRSRFRHGAFLPSGPTGGS